MRYERHANRMIRQLQQDLERLQRIREKRIRRKGDCGHTEATAAAEPLQETATHPQWIDPRGRRLGLLLKLRSAADGLARAMMRFAVQ